MTSARWDSRRGGTIAVVALAGALALCACAPFGGGHPTSPSSSSGPAPSGSGTAQGPGTEAEPGTDGGGLPTPLGHRTARSSELTAQYASVRLDSLTLTQKVASLFMVQPPGVDAVAWQAAVAEHGIGGIILMGDNLPASTEELAALTGSVDSGAGLAPLIAIDEEGGEVARLPQDAFAGADVLKYRPVAETAEAFSGRATLLSAAGISVNFGIVADVTADPDSFIHGRVLGEDPASAAARVEAAVAAEHGTVLSTLKHFPGHGESQADSHSSVPRTDLDESGWLQRDAPPFAAGIAAGAELVMFGHLVYSGVDSQPASLSPAWHEILRGRLGFRGVAVTDDLRMLQDTGLPEYQDPGENAVRAVAAGNDLVLAVESGDPGGMITAVVAAVDSGRIPRSRIDEAALRVLELRRELWLRQHPAARP